MSAQDRLIAGRYRVISRIGGGGMGVVWLAYDEMLHRKVAVKQLLMPPALTGQRGEEANRLAVREGRIAAKLQHPHLVSVYDVVEADGQAYLIMEYLPSTSLAQALAERGPLPPAEVARVGAQAAEGLAAAHAGGVVHRDVKPGNVLLGEDGTVKITDFGVSRAIEDLTATVTGTIAGTPAYLSPEVARGQQATFASDVFSLGATLYAAVEGTPPFGLGDNAMALLYRVASGQITPPAKAGELTGVLDRMLAIDPAHRPTMTEVADTLAAPARPTTPDTTPPAPPIPNFAPPAPPTTDTAPPVPPAPDTAPPTPDTAPPTVDLGAAPAGTRRRGILIAAAVVLVALAGVLLAVLLSRGQPDSGTAAPPAASSTPPVSSGPASSSAPPVTSTAQPAPPPAPATNPPQPTAAPRAEPRTPPEVITAYYALMPGDLRQAWTWLTPKYQQHPAGGYSGYQTFWGRVRTVRATDLTAAGSTVEATVEYAFRDGRVVRERHRYTLIQQDGRWKIDESTVLSSVTL